MSPNSALECPICADEMAVSSSDAAHCAVGLTCCGQRICQSCLYRQILSIFEEGQEPVKVERRCNARSACGLRSFNRQIGA
jgi:C4-type Zn-finger protein